MARTGSFGRLPRALPTLTSTLLAIAREQENQRDENIMSAWQKGGTFEGRKVTDSIMLAHWRGRIEGLAKDDPLYNMYQNALTQFEYSIAESKMTVQHAQGRISDQQAAAFYLNWSKKVPKDSEFYRELQRHAAQLLKQTRARNEAEAARRKEERYTNAQNALDEEKQSGQFVTKVLTLLASQGAEGRGSADLAETYLGPLSEVQSRTNLDELSIDRNDEMNWLISQVNTVAQTRAVRSGALDTEDAPFSSKGYTDNTNDWLFTDDQGRKWTRGEVQAEFKRLDRSFDGTFDAAYVADRLNAEATTIQKQIDLAAKSGHVSDVSRLMQEKAKVVEAAESAQAKPVIDKYVEIKMEQEDIKYGRGAYAGWTDIALGKAYDRTLVRIGALARDPAIAADGKLQSQLTGEARQITGGVTVWEDLHGNRKIGGSTDTPDPGGSEIDSAKAWRQRGRDMEAAIASGEAIMTQGELRKNPDDPNGPPIFVAVAGGSKWGASTLTEINALPGGHLAQPTFIKNGDGTTTPAMIVMKPIFGRIKDKALASQVQLEGADQPIGWMFDYSNGGARVRGYVGQDGKTPQRWLDPQAPVNDKLMDGANIGDDEVHIYLDDYLRGTLADTSEALIPGKPGVKVINPEGHPGVRIEGRRGAFDTPRGGGANPRNPGVTVINVLEYSLATGGTAKAGYMPSAGDTPSLLVLQSKITPDGEKDLAQGRGDPKFEAMMTWSAWWGAGGGSTAEGVPIPPDPALQAQYTEDLRAATSGESGFRLNENKVISYAANRDKAPGTSTVAGAYSLTAPRENDMFGGKLATDALRDMKDERLSALYKRTATGTSTIMPPAKDDASKGFEIATGAGLRLPAYNPSNFNPTSVHGPRPPQGPITTSVAPLTTPATSTSTTGGGTSTQSTNKAYRDRNV